VELFERVGVDRLSMAFCEGVIEWLTIISYENSGGRWHQAGPSNRCVDTG
jgi:hypothetical protein